MSGFLFLLEIVAFVLVAYWADANDKLSIGMPMKGLFRMMGEGGGDAPAPLYRFVPQWRRSTGNPNRRVPFARRPQARFKPNRRPGLTDSRKR
jgi:hypothetical protein